MRALLLFAAFAVAVPNREPLGPPSSEAPVIPADQVLGDWQDTRSTGHMLRITRGESLFLVNNNPSLGDGLTANISIDWSKNPVTIDFRPKQRGGAMYGVLKLEGDQLTINLRTSGNSRPPNFLSGDLLLQYRRVPK